jgi:hypothetical protein
VAENTASALFGVERLRVCDADVEADSTVTVWALTDHPGAASCPDCGAVPGRVHEYVLTRAAGPAPGLGRDHGGLVQAAVEVRHPGVCPQDVHRVAAGDPAALPADLPAAGSAGRGGGRAGAARWPRRAAGSTCPGR